MGSENGERTEKDADSSLTDAFLFIIMYITGLPVEVQLRDGSIFTGIFHTADREKDYVIILKKARMIKKGKYRVNLENGALADTLCIHSGDLVQVFAKGVLPLSEAINIGNIGDDDVKGMTSDCAERQLNSNVMNGISKGDLHCEKVISDTDGVDIPRDTNTHNNLLEESGKGSDVRNTDAEIVRIEEKKNDESQLVESGFSKQIMRTKDEHNRNHEAHKNTNESKLNPDAKTFSPSFGDVKPAVDSFSAVTPNVGYIPVNSSMVFVARETLGSEVGPFFTSVPLKRIPHDNFFPGNNASDSFYFQHIIGQVGSRHQPVTLNGPFSVRTGPSHSYPNSQNIIAGHPEQIVYMQPISQDAIQGAAIFSPGPTRPVLGLHPVHLSKNQVSGDLTHALQLSMPPPSYFAPPVHQPLTIPSHISIPRPFPLTASVPIPVSTPIIGNKFQQSTFF